MGLPEGELLLGCEQEHPSKLSSEPEAQGTDPPRGQDPIPSHSSGTGQDAPSQLLWLQVPPGYALQDLLLILVQAHGEGGLDPDDLHLVHFDLGHTDLLKGKAGVRELLPQRIP